MIIGSAATLYWLVIACSRWVVSSHRMPLIVSFVKWTSFAHGVTALFGWNTVILANAFFPGSPGYSFALWIVGCVLQTIAPFFLIFALTSTS
jgi:hypothetical protein